MTTMQHLVAEYIACKQIQSRLSVMETDFEFKHKDAAADHQLDQLPALLWPQRIPRFPLSHLSAGNPSAAFSILLRNRSAPCLT